jgi:hypothetical protein
MKYRPQTIHLAGPEAGTEEAPAGRLAGDCLNLRAAYQPGGAAANATRVAALFKEHAAPLTVVRG